MTDTKRELFCPACGKIMKKIYIKSAKCNLDVCTEGCGGIYFDNYEFKKMDERAEDVHELIEALSGKNFEKVDESQTRVCPVCNHNMVKHFASAKKEVEIDECYSCGGIFLDGGELMAIREQFKTEKERIEHFNSVFAAEHSDALESINKMESQIDRNRLKRVEAVGNLFRKIFS